MKPCTMRDSEMSKKYKRVVMYKKNNRVNAVVGAHVIGYRKVADNSWTLPTSIDSMVTLLTFL
jgi:hypothetical protein